MKKLNLNETKIINLYNKGLSCQKIADKLQVSESFISKLLSRKQLKKRSNSIYRRQNVCNYTFFEEINTEEKAYFLGLFFADGNITIRKSGQKVVQIQLNDKKPVFDFLKNIEANFKPYIYKNSIGNTVYKVQITSEKMFSDLEKLGCVERKSLILKYPVNLDSSFDQAFIRGYFDGDGSVYLTKDDKSIGISFNGTKEFLEVVNSKLPSPMSFNKEERKISNTYYLRCSGPNRVLPYYNYLYENSNQFFERKKFKFEKFYKKRFNDYNKQS